MVRPLLVLALLACPAALVAQGPATSRPRAPLAAPDARVVALPAALYNEQANVIEATDARKAEVATEVLRARLAERLGARLVAAAETERLAAAPDARATTGGLACQVKLACARAVGRLADAAWVVMAKVSKTSNLIWLLSAQLVHVPTGEIVLDDSTELKGDAEAMTRVGVRNFADRVARTVAAGGVVSDYPNGEPAYVGPNPRMTP